ncbi:autotransporter-associated beta strand repeat-containing protein [Gemmata sp. JC673]|uniref:Autotransporter-associated beta strand repeat-containing protein n=1 Tax=Gemmata algarum TaxID=2975278 RepID=A0ABU5F7Z7_9BACT|nr:autotransporter-associated beta strand repeat-containing protein [Gemmata algarum]MDY3563725.1 autotransporter-associated beta strand repeat-containing protein [Gemmata algarum]
MTLFASATLDLNNFDDAIGTLNLIGATVTTGAGTLTLGGDVVTNSASVTSVISGKLDLGGANRTFTVADNASLDPDLSITANISGTGAGLIKAGANSQLLLSGNNTYDGATTISAGVIEIASDNALGTTNGGTTVASGASVYLSGTNLMVSEAFVIQGTGVGGQGVLVLTDNSSATLTGFIDMLANSLIGAGVDATLTLRGRIDDTNVSPARNLAITNASSGRIILDAQQRYDGTLTVTSGYVRAARYGALVDPAVTQTITIQDGATLEFSGSFVTPQPAIQTIVLNGGGAESGPKLINVGGANRVLGPVRFGGNGTIFAAAGSTLTLSGVISETGGSRPLLKDGSGTLILGGANTYTGQTTVDAGTLIINGNITSSSDVSVATGGTLGGGGTVPGVVLSAGATIAPGNSPGLLQSGSVTFVSGSTYSVELNGTTAGTQYDRTNVTGTVTLAGATLSLSLGYAPAVGAQFALITNDGSDAVVGTFAGLAEGATVTAGSATFTISYAGGDGNDVVLTVTGVTYTWTGLGGDSNWSTAANWDANQAPTGGENLVFPAGAARLTNTNDLSGKSFHSIAFGGAGYAITGNAIAVTNGIAATYAAGSSTFGLDTTLTASGTIDVATGGSLTISGAIGDGASSFGLTKTGGGTLTLSGANTYDGTTTISGGVLGVATDANLGSGAVALDGGTLGVTSSGSIPTIDNAINIGSNGGTIANSGLNLRLSGQITAAAGVTTTFSCSTRSLVIALLKTDNNSSFLGDVALNSCTLEAANSGALNAGSITLGTSALQFPVSGSTYTVANDLILTSAATLQTSNNTITFSGSITGAFSLTKLGSGTAILTGANSYGATTVSFGTLSVGGDGNLGTGAVTLGGSATFALTNGATIDNAVTLSGGTVSVASGSSALTGTVSGSGTLTKTGAGTLTLSAPAAYTGATTVSAGTLLVDGSIATSSGLTVASGATVGGSGALPATTVAAGGTLAPGNAPGAVSTGALAFATGSTYAVELNGTTAGTQYEQLNVAGTVNLAGATLATTLGFTPAGGDTFVLISNDSSDAVIGTFAGLSEGGTFLLGGTTFRISYAGGDGNDVTLTAVPLPALSVTGASVAEGNSGTTALTFTVTLSAPSLQTVTVAYATADGTATAGTDYTAASGMLTFAPGVTTQTVTVLVDGDTAVEADETFRVVLSSPVGATVAIESGTGTITNDDTASRIVLGPVGGMVQQLDPVTGRPGASVPAYTGFAGEVRVASDDVDGDGVADLITGAGAGSMGGHVKVFDGATGAQRFSFLSFDGFAGGVFVATGDVNGDGVDDIVVSADAGAAPHVKVFSGADGSLLRSFLAYDAGFRGGVRVAVGDVDGDGFADIVTGNGAGAAANVKVFSGKDGALLKSFLAYDAGFRGGIYVGAGDVTGDGLADVITGSGAGAPGGHVKVFSGQGFALERSFFAFDPGFVGGVRVGTAVVNGETVVLVGSGPGTRGHFKAIGANELLSMFAAGSDLGGVYVA